MTKQTTIVVIGALRVNIGWTTIEEAIKDTFALEFWAWDSKSESANWWVDTSIGFCDSIWSS